MCVGSVLHVLHMSSAVPIKQQVEQHLCTGPIEALAGWAHSVSRISELILTFILILTPLTSWNELWHYVAKLAHYQGV